MRLTMLGDFVDRSLAGNRVGVIGVCMLHFGDMLAVAAQLVRFAGRGIRAAMRGRSLMLALPFLAHESLR